MAGEEEDYSGIPIEVCAIVALDKDNLINDGTGRTPYQYKGSGQKAAISQRVANETVVLDYSMALEMGGRPPGKRVIVLSRESPTYRYSRSRKTHVERSLPDLWHGAEVAHSVPEVFSMCKSERAIYVLGGQSTFRAFRPYTSVVRKFVLNGDPIPFAQTTSMRAYFYALPCAPLSVETPSPHYCVETYRLIPALNVPSFDAASTGTRGDGPWGHAPEKADGVPSSVPTRSTLARASRFFDEDGVPDAAHATTGAPTQVGLPRGVPLPPSYAQQARVCGSEDKALEQALQESIRDAPLAGGGDALNDIDYWQFLIQEFDRVQRLGAVDENRPCSKGVDAKRDAKGKAKLADDEDDAPSRNEQEQEPVTARGLVIRPTKSDAKESHENNEVAPAVELDVDGKDAADGDEDLLIDSDVEYDPDDYRSDSCGESDREDDTYECLSSSSSP